MVKINQVERMSTTSGLYGLIFGNSKGKLQAKVEEMNQRRWGLQLLHGDSLNIIHAIIRTLVLALTFGIWIFGSSELLIFEKERD